MNFNLSKVKLSNNDIKRKLKLPEKPSKELAEFIGVLIGDGYIHNNKNKYVIGIVGNPKEDVNYFNKLRQLIFILFNIRVNITKTGRGLRLIFRSKGVFYFITQVLNLEYGKGKGQRVKIPEIFLNNKELSSFLLRGLFDADGTVFTSYKRGVSDYPTIELTTTSLILAQQVKELLIRKGFRVAGVREYKYKHSELLSLKVSLYGKKNVFKWHIEIGFSNSNKHDKLIKIVKTGDRGI